jgi:acetyl esterase/lipase
MRWPVSTLLLCAACGADVEVQTVTYDSRHDRGDMDIHATVSADVTAPGGRPAVLLIHGGGWWTGDRSDMSRGADRLARAGYVAATIDYRLVPDGAFPIAVQDAFCSLAYLRRHAAELGIDPDRIAAMGYSAGAHLVAMLGVAADVDELQDDGCPSGRTGPASAVIAGAGPFDLTGLDDETTRNFVGVPLDDRNLPRYQAASPIHHVDPGEPPFLLIHAEADQVVDVEQSRRMRETLRADGNHALLLELEGGGHGIGDGAGLGNEQLEVAIDTPESWLATVDFLDLTVGAP